jgi:sulfur carrier protein ThiS
MLKSYLGELKEAEVEAGHPVREAIISIGINPDLVAGVFVNGDLETKDYILQDGDIVKLLAVIGGG